MHKIEFDYRAQSFGIFSEKSHQLKLHTHAHNYQLCVCVSYSRLKFNQLSRRVQTIKSKSIFVTVVLNIFILHFRFRKKHNLFNSIIVHSICVCIRMQKIIQFMKKKSWTNPRRIRDYDTIQFHFNWWWRKKKICEPIQRFY